MITLPPGPVAREYSRRIAGRREALTLLLGRAAGEPRNHIWRTYLRGTIPKVNPAALRREAANLERFSGSPIPSGLHCGADDYAGDQRDYAAHAAKRLRALARALERA